MNYKLEDKLFEINVFFIIFFHSFALFFFIFFKSSFFGCALIEPIQKYAVIGNNFTISCETTTTRTPFIWIKDGINLTESNTRFVLKVKSTLGSKRKNLFVFILYLIDYISILITMINQT